MVAFVVFILCPGPYMTRPMLYQPGVTGDTDFILKLSDHWICDVLN